MSMRYRTASHLGFGLVVCCSSDTPRKQGPDGTIHKGSKSDPYGEAVMQGIAVIECRVECSAATLLSNKLPMKTNTVDRKYGRGHVNYLRYVLKYCWRFSDCWNSKKLSILRGRWILYLSNIEC
jgi:hypothetical protein